MFHTSRAAVACVISGLAILLSCDTAMTQGANDQTAGVKAAFNGFSRAVLSKKFEKTLNYETPDFRSTMDGGRPLDGKQVVDQMRREASSLTSLKDMHFTIKSVTIKDFKANATADYVYDCMVTDVPGKIGPKGKQHNMTMVGQCIATLTKGPTGWKFNTMAMRRTNILMDGKPLAKFRAEAENGHR